MFKNKIHFEISERKMILHFFDVFFVLLGLYVIGTTFDLTYLKEVVLTRSCVVLFVTYLTVIGIIFEMYQLQVASNELQILKSVLLTVSSTVLIYLLTPIFSPILPNNRTQIILFYGIVLVTLLAWRFFYVRFLASNRFVQNALLICDESQVQELISGLENIEPHYKIIAYVATDRDSDSVFYPLVTPYVECVKREDLFSYVNVRGISEIVIASQTSEGITPVLYHHLLQLLESGKLIKEYTKVYEAKTQRIPVQFIARDFYRFFPFSRSNQNKLYLTIVRVFEIICSLLGLFIGLVLIPLIMIGNLLGNKGKLFYSQKRIGKDGIPFRILKFRTIIENNKTNAAVFTTNTTKRITAFGKFLRKTRIDEIPQVLNILKGDMAIIGPRPERPLTVKKIARQMPFYETRHVIKPGLTGWAQVNYSYGENMDDSLIKLQYDLYYIKHRSVYLDLDIILKTITTVLFYRGQ